MRTLLLPSAHSLLSFPLPFSSPPPHRLVFFAIAVALQGFPDHSVSPNCLLYDHHRIFSLSTAKMASQQNTPYYPVDSGDVHQDGLPVDPLRSYTDNPSPTYERPQDPPFDPDGFSANDLVHDGVARPRFLGHATGGARGSFASSFGVQSTLNDADNSSSVYALNPLVNRDSGRYSSVPYQDDPHDSDLAAGSVSPGTRNKYLEEKRDTYAPPNKSKRKMVIVAIVVGVAVAAIGIVVALYFTVIKKNGKTSDALGNNNNNGNGNGNNNPNNGNGNNNNTTNNILKSGGNGSTIHLDNGTTIIYSNPFGGTWYWDPDDPFNNNAQAQSWTPPLNQSFKWGTDRIFGSVSRPSFQGFALIFASSQCQSWWLACNRTCKFPDNLGFAH
jgi:hypothetical protein